MRANRPPTPDSRGRADGPPEPVVPPEVYGESYYRDCCAGSRVWSESEGREMAAIYPAVLDMAGFQAGETLVDIGTGRGELVALAAERGAARAVGIEYSPAAVRLARQTIETHDVGDRAEVHLADARDVPLPDGEADLVTMLDVVEHLAPAELQRTLAEARRLLRPGGLVLIHTMPSRTVYEVTYRLQRMLHPRRRRQWPADPRNDHERLMHVNEQTVGSLRRALRGAGFRPAQARLGRWVYTDFVPDERAKALYARLARWPLVARLGVGDIWGEGRKPA